MWIRANNSSGGGGTFVINPQKLTRNGTPYTVRCSKAYINIGMKTSYGEYYIGYVENGTLTTITNYQSTFSVSYSNGVLSISKTGTAVSDDNSWIKIMYE